MRSWWEVAFLRRTAAALSTCRPYLRSFESQLRFAEKMIWRFDRSEKRLVKNYFLKYEYGAHSDMWERCDGEDSNVWNESSIGNVATFIAFLHLLFCKTSTMLNSTALVSCHVHFILLSTSGRRMLRLINNVHLLVVYLPAFSTKKQLVENVILWDVKYLFRDLHNQWRCHWGGAYQLLRTQRSGNSWWESLMNLST